MGRNEGAETGKSKPALVYKWEFLDILFVDCSVAGVNPAQVTIRGSVPSLHRFPFNHQLQSRLKREEKGREIDFCS